MLSHVQWTGIALLPVALIGSLFNWIVIIAIFKLPSFKHSFGFLSANQAIADAIHSTTFLLFFCPMVIFESQFLQLHSSHCGFMLLFCYELSVHTHFIISLNRLFAVFAPYKYNMLFSNRNTKVIIAVVWIITLSTTFIYYEIICSMYYNEQTGFFFFTNSEICGVISWYTDFCKNLTVVVIIVIIDVSTVIRVRFINRKVISSIDTTTNNRISNREINFLRQTVFQGSIFALELVTYFIIPPYLSDKWTIFLCTSFAWVTVHAADGVVAVFCNPEIRKFFFSCGGKSHKFESSQQTHPSHTQQQQSGINQ